MAPEDIRGGGEVVPMICPEAEHGSGLGFGSQPAEKLRLDQAMFPMAALGPGVGKEHEDVRTDSGIGRKRLQQERGLGVNPRDVLQLQALALPFRPLKTVRQHVHAQTELGWMIRGVGGQKVSVPATDLQSDAGPVCQQWDQACARLLQAVLSNGASFINWHNRRIWGGRMPPINPENRCRIRRAA